MAPPKKGQKMSLGDFLTDDSLGTAPTSSWADEMEDMPLPSAPSTYQRRDYGAPSSTAGPAGDRFSGYSRADEPSRAQLPIPDKPPYTAHVGNLSFDASEAEISEFFADCDVTNVRLVRDKMDDRPKGFGYVEFGTREGLVAALDRSGAQLAGRNVRVSVAEPPKERSEAHSASEWRRSGPLPPLERETAPRRSNNYERYGGDREEGGRRGYEGGEARRDFTWERKGPLSPITPSAEHGPRTPRGDSFRNRSPAPGSESGRQSSFRDRPHFERQPTAAEQDNQWRKPRAESTQRSTPASPVMAQVRPKLALQKRSEQVVQTVSTPTPSADKPNPFGAARPIDTFQREKEVEEKRAAAAAERKAREEKEREEKKAAAAAKAAAEAETPAQEEVKTEAKTEAAPEGAAEAPKPAAPKVEKPAPKVPDNWRARGAPKEPQEPRNARGPREARAPREGKPAAENKEGKDAKGAEADSDGWSTVQKPRRGGRAVPA